MVRSTFSNFQLHKTVLLTRVTLDPQNLHFLQLKFVPFDLHHPVFPLSSPWVKWSDICSVMSNSLLPTDYTVHGILQARILQWVAFSFSRGSSPPRDQTQVSCIAGGFFTSWATREAQEYWGGEPIPSPGDLSNPRIKPGSPALQADSLPNELSGKQKS